MFLNIKQDIFGSFNFHSLFILSFFLSFSPPPLLSSPQFSAGGQSPPGASLLPNAELIRLAE